MSVSAFEIASFVEFKSLPIVLNESINKRRRDPNRAGDLVLGLSPLMRQNVKRESHSVLPNVVGCQQLNNVAALYGQV